MKNRKVLFISYRFPPEASAGSIRSFKFVKYLPRLGNDITVLTVTNPPENSIDNNTINELPNSGVEIIRARRTEPATVCSFFEKSKFKLIHGLGWRLSGLLNSILYPDFSALWILYILPKAFWLCRTRKYDVIYSTYAPLSNHTVALLLCKLFKIPWVADFRDLWIHDFEYLPKSSIQRKFDKQLELLFVKNSSAVITTSTGLTEIMRQEYSVYASKIITIPNGFDPQDSPGKEVYVKTEPNQVIFAHIGTLYSSRSVNHILDAIDEVLAKHQHDNISIIFRLVGNINGDVSIPKFFKVVKTGWCTRENAILEMASADICVLTLHSAEGGKHPVPQKLYEYLAFGKNVLATGNNNCFSSDILSLFDNAQFVEHDDLSKLKQVIEGYLDNMKQLGEKPNNNIVQLFSRENIAERLDNVFTSIIKNDRVLNLDFSIETDLKNECWK